MVHDKKLIKAVQTLIEHPAGFGIELFMIIGVYRLEDGRYAVGGDPLEEYPEQIFDEPRDAAVAFLDLREKNKVGFDFEKILR